MNQVNDTLGINFGRDLVKIRAKQLAPPQIIFGQNNRMDDGRVANFMLKDPV